MAFIDWGCTGTFSAGLCARDIGALGLPHEMIAQKTRYALRSLLFLAEGNAGIANATADGIRDIVAGFPECVPVDPVLIREDGSFLYTLPSVVDDVDAPVDRCVLLVSGTLTVPLAPVLADAEEEVESSLRPRTLADFVAQDRVKEQLSIALEAAKARGQKHVVIDPRRTETAEGRTYTMSDTVGFVRQLPTQLVEAFRSTLEEVTLASLVLHVADASSPLLEDQVKAVREVLGDIGGLLRRRVKRRHCRARVEQAGYEHQRNSRARRPSSSSTTSPSCGPSRRPSPARRSPPPAFVPATWSRCPERVPTADPWPPTTTTRCVLR